jgi:hypothetical protein
MNYLTLPSLVYFSQNGGVRLQNVTVSNFFFSEGVFSSASAVLETNISISQVSMSQFNIYGIYETRTTDSAVFLNFTTQTTKSSIIIIGLDISDIKLSGKKSFIIANSGIVSIQDFASSRMSL